MLKSRKLFRCAHCDWEGEDPKAHDPEACAKRKVQESAGRLRSPIRLMSEVEHEMLIGYVLAIDSDKAELVAAPTWFEGQIPAPRPVDREIAFQMVTSRHEDSETPRYWWMTRKRIGQRSGWEELGLKAGPSYWCMMQ